MEVADLAGADVLGGDLIEVKKSTSSSHSPHEAAQQVLDHAGEREEALGNISSSIRLLGPSSVAAGPEKRIRGRRAHSTPNASSTLPDTLCCIAYPEPMNSMPPTIAGPCPPIEPPRAATPVVRLEGAQGVVLPQHLAVTGRVGAEHPVPAAGEDHARG